MLFIAKIILLDMLLKEEPLLNYCGWASWITNTILMEGTNFPFDLIFNDAFFVTDEQDFFEILRGHISCLLYLLLQT